MNIGCTVPESETLELPHAQAPLEQVWPDAHVLPQPPQFAESDDVWTQLPPQSVPPFEQAHFPAEQVVPLVHTLPHAPQLFGSVDVLMQEPLHADVPLGHWQ